MSNRKRRVLEIIDVVLIGLGVFSALLFSAINTVFCLISVCVVVLLLNLFNLLVHREI